MSRPSPFSFLAAREMPGVLPTLGKPYHLGFRARAGGREERLENQWPRKAAWKYGKYGTREGSRGCVSGWTRTRSQRRDVTPRKKKATFERQTFGPRSSITVRPRRAWLVGLNDLDLSWRSWSRLGDQATSRAIVQRARQFRPPVRPPVRSPRSKPPPALLLRPAGTPQKQNKKLLILFRPRPRCAKTRRPPRPAPAGPTSTHAVAGGVLNETAGKGGSYHNSVANPPAGRRTSQPPRPRHGVACL